MYQLSKKPRMSVRPPPPVVRSPYDVKLEPDESMPEYMDRMNIYKRWSNYNTQARQVHVIISNLPQYPSWAPIKEKYGDVFVDEKPNVEKYSHDGI